MGATPVAAGGAACLGRETSAWHSRAGTRAYGAIRSGLLTVSLQHTDSETIAEQGLHAAQFAKVASR